MSINVYQCLPIFIHGSVLHKIALTEDLPGASIFDGRKTGYFLDWKCWSDAVLVLRGRSSANEGSACNIWVSAVGQMTIYHDKTHILLLLTRAFFEGQSTCFQRYSRVLGRLQKQKASAIRIALWRVNLPNYKN